MCVWPGVAAIVAEAGGGYSGATLLVIECYIVVRAICEQNVQEVHVRVAASIFYWLGVCMYNIWYFDLVVW